MRLPSLSVSYLRPKTGRWVAGVIASEAAARSDPGKKAEARVHRRCGSENILDTGSEFITMINCRPFRPKPRAFLQLFPAAENSSGHNGTPRQRQSYKRYKAKKAQRQAERVTMLKRVTFLTLLTFNPTASFGFRRLAMPISVFCRSHAFWFLPESRSPNSGGPEFKRLQKKVHRYDGVGNSASPIWRTRHQPSQRRRAIVAWVEITGNEGQPMRQ